MTVYDFWGQRGTQFVSIQALAPPPPAIIVYTPTATSGLIHRADNLTERHGWNVGALKGFCILIDALPIQHPATCMQDMSAIKSTNTAWQPLFFTKPLRRYA